MAETMKCPKCNGPVLPMRGKANGKGFNCAKQKYVGGDGSCNGVIWTKSKSAFYSKQQSIERAASWPVIANPTAEQLAFRSHMGTAPAARGGRCTVADAVPGSGKTTTQAWSMEAVYKRIGNLIASYGQRAFNKNAAVLLASKLPAIVGDVDTLHAAGKKAQGNKGLAELWKINRHFRALVAGIPEKERPHIGKLKTVLERCRNLCLWTTPDDRGGWNDILATVLARFPSLAKKCKGREKHLQDWLPALADSTLADGAKFDYSDMITRPVLLAMRKTGWRMDPALVLKSASDWTDSEVGHFAKLIRTILLPDTTGLVVDEAQDTDLAQIACILAQTWRRGELTLVGDDRCGNPGQEGWKAGQAIYGWRGAFSGSLTLIARLWKELTGEDAVRLGLTVTFRHGPEICNAYRPLNSVVTSALPAGQSAAYACGPDEAFGAWLALPVDNTALWITRTNAAMTPVFLDTLRNHEDCTIRGGPDFAGAVTDALSEAAGEPDANGDYATDLSTCLANLSRIVAEMTEDGGEADPNCLEGFMLDMGEALRKEPALLGKANLTGLTVGNLRRFVLYFADKSSRRVITNVYRCKGDEADLSVVADVAKFNECWGDSHEDDACRHVALSRARILLLTVGAVTGSSVKRAADDTDLDTLVESLSEVRNA